MKSTVLNQINKQLSDVRFTEAKTFYWSPQTKTIYMNSRALEIDEGKWALLHEAGHAVLEHTVYHTDAGLLMLEVEAWQAAQKLGEKISVTIPDEHIQDCLNTYRDWLYARSSCPTCGLNSLQIDQATYLCMNCATRWSVSESRFCRPYRMQSRYKKTPSETNQTVFAEKLTN